MCNSCHQVLSRYTNQRGKPFHSRLLFFNHYVIQTQAETKKKLSADTSTALEAGKSEDRLRDGPLGTDWSIMWRGEQLVGTRRSLMAHPKLTWQDTIILLNHHLAVLFHNVPSPPCILYEGVPLIWSRLHYILDNLAATMHTITNSIIAY